MIIKCYIIENSAECAIAVRNLEAAIPCFTKLELLEDNSVEYTISCRAEDVCIAEIFLAPFV